MLDNLLVINDNNYTRCTIINHIFTICENNNFSLHIMWITIKNFDLYLSFLDQKEIKNNKLEYLLLSALICLLISCKLDGKLISLDLKNLYGNFNLTLKELKVKKYNY